MKNYLLLKYLITHLKKYTFIFFITTIFILIPSLKILAEENVFTLQNVKVKGKINLNFSRDKYLNVAFKKSWEILMSKILLSKDLSKVSNIELKQIKKLISSFQILEEKHSKNQYEAQIKIIFNDLKVKEFLSKKNISFSRAGNISSIFFPVLIVNNEIKNFNENFFYKKWNEIEIKNNLINFILPIEDLEDVSKLLEMKDKIEELDVESLVGKYDVKNYVFAIIDNQNLNLNVHLKINFNDNYTSKNITYELKNVEDEIELAEIIKDLKVKITDLWKREKLINILMPLLIKIRFEHKNIESLDKLKKTFNRISIINNYNLEQFNINDSYFKIYYFGDPKRLKSEFLNYGYRLDDNQGNWQIYLNE